MKKKHSTVKETKGEENKKKMKSCIKKEQWKKKRQDKFKFDIYGFNEKKKLYIELH